MFSIVHSKDPWLEAVEWLPFSSYLKSHWLDLNSAKRDIETIKAQNDDICKKLEAIQAGIFKMVDQVVPRN